MQAVRNWRFYRGEVAGAEAPMFKDLAWRTVTVPHDASIEVVPGTDSPFSETLSGGRPNTGWTVGGEMWYRTTVDYAPSTPDIAADRAELIFDGASLRTDVFVDGVAQLHHPYGYTPFCVDLGGCQATPRSVAVRLRNLGDNSRWYSGSGLYRTVTRRTTGLAYLVWDGLFVHSTAISDTEATLAITVEVADAGDQPRPTVLSVRGRDPQGNLAFEVTAPVTTVPGQVVTVNLSANIQNPQRWIPCELTDDPNALPARYEVVAELTSDGTVQDRLEAPLGLRTVTMSPEEGLRINGQPLVLKGGCIHHDLGILGAAAWAGAEDHRVRTLKAAGFTALRTAHNPPSRSFLHACDRHGVLVLDEVHDEWEISKTPNGYFSDFAENGLADARAMVRRDRNHPCVFAWSVGNEIKDSFNRPDIAEALTRTVRESDPTRRVTAAICWPWWEPEFNGKWESIEEPAFRHFDLGGYNYLPQKYRSEHLRHPDRIMVGLESYARAFETLWREVTQLPYVIGDFLWTAQDYFGESGIGQSFRDGEETRDGEFPYHLAICGDLDLIGDRRPANYFREAIWGKDVLHMVVHTPTQPGREPIRDGEGWRFQWGWDDVVQHWTWSEPETTQMKVHLYTDALNVTLWVNGVCVGGLGRTADSTRQLVMPANYHPGVLEARAITADGRELRTRLVTATEPAAVQLKALTLKAEWTEESMLYAGVTIVDAAGTPAPHADSRLSVEIAGPAVLAGFGNASPNDLEDLQDAQHRAWRGRALVAVRPTGPGPITLTVHGENLTPARIELN